METIKFPAGRGLLPILLLASLSSPASAQSVKGTWTDDNAGALTLVDGIAWRGAAAAGTVVQLTTKAIASDALGKACPVTEAQFLTLLRDAAWVEVAPDAAGQSKYFTWGRNFGESRGGRETAGDPSAWTITLRKSPPARIAGQVVSGDKGTFDFDLPIRRPVVSETSGAASFDDGPRERPATAAEAKAFRAAFQTVRAAALARDFPGFLSAQGFTAAQAAAIRALPGIEDEFATLAGRFLATEEKLGTPAFRGRRGAMTAEGADAQGQRFFNWYYLTKCGTRYLLTAIAQNPQ